jgi:SAM-dependent methyltransferase
MASVLTETFHRGVYLPMDFDEYAQVKSMVGAVPESWTRPFWKNLGAKDVTTVRLLDYGAGDGRYFHFLTSNGFLPENIHGIEISQTRVERCRAKGWENVHLVSSAHHLPFADHFFDVVNLVEVIEHMPKGDVDFYLGEIARVLKPEGFFLLTTPNYPIKRFYDVVDALRTRQWVRLRDDPTHVAFYNRSRLEKLLKRHFEKFSFGVYKEGFVHRRIRRAFFLHKILAVCRDPIPS